MKTFNITNIELETIDNAKLAVFTLKCEKEELKYAEWINVNEYDDTLELESTDSQTSCSYNDDTLEALDIEDRDNADLINILEKSLNKEYNCKQIREDILELQASK